MKKVEKLLLEIDSESIAAKKGNYIGWIKPRDYKEVNELMKKLRVGPYSE